jgi:hypothetical protein
MLFGGRAVQSKRKLENTYRRLDRDRLVGGVIYGLLGGFTFAAAAWGYDGWLLSHASADNPWLKFVLGGTCCLLAGGFVGWLTERTGRALVGFVGWLLVGWSFAWLASRLPFEVLTQVWRLLDPQLSGLDIYPFASNISLRMITIYIVVLPMLGIAGLLQSVLVESAIGNAAILGRWLPYLVSIPLFALAGSAADDVNQPFRDAILGVDRAIQMVITQASQPIDRLEAIDLGGRAADPIRDLFDRPYRLILGDYDPEYLDTFSVFVDFGGEWAFCTTLFDRASTCQKSDIAYPKKLACLMNGGSMDECIIDVTQPAQTWLDSWQEQDLPIPEMHTVAQRGAVTLMSLSAADGGAYTCRFSGTHFSTVLEACAPQK